MSATAVAATTTIPARMSCRRKDDAVRASGRIFIFVTTRSLHTTNDCGDQLRSTRQRGSATAPQPDRPAQGPGFLSSNASLDWHGPDLCMAGVSVGVVESPSAR